MPHLDIGALRAVAARLDKTHLTYAFTGGSIVNLLLDDPDFAPARPTNDVDVIIELLSSTRYSDIEQTLRDLGFQHDMSEGAPMCRWRLEKLVVDIMPTIGEQLGLNTKWFKEVLDCSIETQYAHTQLKIVSPVGFLVTKYLAFSEGGDSDYYASHDLEDFITVIDGREQIVAEVEQTPPPLKDYLVNAIKALHSSPDFSEALAGHLPADTASQERLPKLRDKIRSITELPIHKP